MTDSTIVNKHLMIVKVTKKIEILGYSSERLFLQVIWGRIENDVQCDDGIELL